MSEIYDKLCSSVQFLLVILKLENSRILQVSSPKFLERQESYYVTIPVIECQRSRDHILHLDLTINDDGSLFCFTRTDEAHRTHRWAQGSKSLLHAESSNIRQDKVAH